MNKEEELIDRLIDLAFAEDIGDGDHTTLSCIPATAMGKSKLWENNIIQCLHRSKFKSGKLARGYCRKEGRQNRL